MRKEQFKRPEPGFSMYEGRTRGKKMKYTYSDDEDMFDSESTNRRSTRNTGTHTPIETGPITTSSGRQIRAPTRLNPVTGSSAPGSEQGDTPDFEKENSVGPTGRPRRSAAVNHGTNGWSGSNPRSRQNTSDDSEGDESEAEFGDDEEDAHVPEESEEEDEFDENEAMVEDDLDDQPRSLVVKLSVTPPKLRNLLVTDAKAGNIVVAPGENDEEKKANVPDAPLVEMQDAPAIETPSKAVSNPTDTPNSGRASEIDIVSPERSINVAGRQPPTPSIHVSPLAFRGSPEKSYVQPISQPVDIGTQE